MPTLKNGPKLRKRVRQHAEADQIARQTYGMVKMNADFDMKGCAIFCLAIPVKRKKVRSLLDGAVAGARRRLTENLRYGASSGDYEQTGVARATVRRDRDGTEHISAEFREDLLLNRLEQQFGICAQLAKLGEVVFEAKALEVEEAAEWVGAFADVIASREGDHCDDEMVTKFWAGLDERYDPQGTQLGRKLSWTAMLGTNRAVVEDVKDEILAWVDAGFPQAVRA